MESSFVFFSTFVISVLQFALKQLQKEYNKIPGEVEANDETSCKGSLNSVIFGVLKPGGVLLPKSEPLECESWENDKQVQAVVDRDVYSARYSRLTDDKAWFFSKVESW